MKPSVARTVLYVLSQQDCDTINLERMRLADALGCSAGSIGNTPKPGEIVPLVIVRVWTDTCVNGQLILDGLDRLWKTSASRDDEKTHGSWHWPERVPVALEATAELKCERIERPSVEQLTEKMYAAYCLAVGGKAYNGDELPTWEVFAADPEKTKQALAWRYAAAIAIGELA